MAYPVSLYDTLVDNISAATLRTTNLNDSTYSHVTVHRNDAVELIALETYLGTNASQTTPTAANSLLQATSASVSTWTTTPTIAGLTITGAADAIRLKLTGHSTQTTSLMVLEQSDGTDVFTVSNAGNTQVAGTFGSTGAATFSSTVALNGVPTIANNVALTLAHTGGTSSTIKQTTNNDLQLKIGTAAKKLIVLNSSDQEIFNINQNDATLNANLGYKVISYGSGGVNYAAMYHNNVDSMVLESFVGGQISVRPQSGAFSHTGTFFPNGNNAHDIGSAGNHHRDIFVQNAVTVVSDENKKRDIESLAEAQVVQLMRGIEGYSYRWKDHMVQEYYQEEQEVINVIEVDAENVEYTTKKQVGKFRDVMTSHHRKHTGFIADQIKGQLDLMSINTEDFAAYVEDKDGNKALRSDELLPWLLMYIQSVDKRLLAIEK